MAGRKQWTAAVASAIGSTTITTKPCLVGGFGIQSNLETSTDMRILDGVGGVQRLRYGKVCGGIDGTTVGDAVWVNLTHPILLGNGLAVSVGEGANSKGGRVTCVYKEI